MMSEPGRAMTSVSSEKSAGKQAEARSCRRCGAEPKLVSTMLDSVKGGTLRIFKCQCGERDWVID
jgi:hypothetical protein